MTVLPGLEAMKVNAAIGLSLAGLSLYLAPARGRGAWRQTLASALAVTVALIGALTLWEYIAGSSLGIDDLIIHDQWAAKNVGRMAPISAMNFVLLGLALALLGKTGKELWVQRLAGIVAFVSWLAVIGYCYRSSALYQVKDFTAIALHTAITFLVLSSGLFCATSQSGIMRLLTSSATSGRMARRYGLAAILIPFVIGWLRLQGERAGLYGFELGLSILTMANVTTFAALVYLGARSLEAAEAKKELVQAKLQLAHDELEDRVAARTQELTAAQKLLKEVLDAATGFSVIAADQEGRITLFNSGSERMLGYQAAEMIGQSPAQLHLEAEVRARGAQLSAEFGRPIEGFDVFVANAKLGRSDTRQWTYRRKDGSLLTVSLDITATRSESGELSGFLGIATDITEQLRAEVALKESKEAAEAANRAKSEFLANMSHEIRTPMNGIIGMTELALDGELNVEQRSYLGMARASAHSLLRLINDILDFSKIEAGKLELETIPFSMRECVGTLLKPLALRAEQKGLELTADLAPEVPDFVMGDPLRLRQILSNLTDNAIKFTASGDVSLRIVVESIEPTGHSLRFSVTDTGVGIAPDKQALIFDAFSQADGSTTRTYGGTGLGLAIVSQLVEQMGGRLWIDSVPGHGTTFHFTAKLPVAPAPVTSVRPADPSRLRGLPVLIIDDNEINRRILHQTFRHWEMLPTLAASGAEGLRIMQQAAQVGSPFPLVILDWMMPGMDGFAVAKKVRDAEGLAGATIMMLSSAMLEGAAKRCAELHVASYLLKPVPQLELLEAILSALGVPAQAESAAAPEPGVKVNAPTTRKMHILIAEDNLINRTLAAALLSKRGHSLVQAVNGKEAVEAVAREPFDLVFMDVQMPEMDGFEATGIIRRAELSTGRHTPIVAMTAHAMTGDRERCLEAGMDDYISKPLDQNNLNDLLERLAHGSGPAASAGAPAGGTAPATDSRAKLITTFDDDEEMLAKMVAILHRETPTLLGDIRAAIERGDAAKLEEAAHRVQGTLSVFGANPARNLAKALELMGRRNELTNAAATLRALEQAMDEVFAALDGFVR